ncbi:MAG: hypothetical protein RMY28_032020 [Nostoc sp. ChiSLP01]
MVISHWVWGIGQAGGVGGWGRNLSPLSPHTSHTPASPRPRVSPSPQSLEYYFVKISFSS